MVLPTRMPISPFSRRWLGGPIVIAIRLARARTRLGTISNKLVQRQNALATLRCELQKAAGKISRLGGRVEEIDSIEAARHGHPDFEIVVSDGWLITIVTDRSAHGRSLSASNC
jgi:hypothetical protein